MVLRERRKILSIQEGIFTSGLREVKMQAPAFEGTSSVVGVQTGVATIKDSMGVSPKTFKTGTTL